MNIDILYKNIKSSINNVGVSHYISTKEISISIKNNIVLDKKIESFIEKLKIFLNSNLQSNIVSDEKLKYYICETDYESKELIEFFDNELIYPDKGILSQLPNGGGVIAKISKCKKYLIIKWHESGIFLYRVDSKSLILLRLNNDKSFISMIMYFLITPFVYTKVITPIHGSVVSYNKLNYLIIGDSNKGKTSFTLAFWINGGNVITEDFTYMRSNGIILGLPIRDYFTLRIGTLNRFKEYFEEIDLTRYESLSENDIYKLGKINQIRVPIEHIIDENKLRNSYEIDVILIPNISAENNGCDIRKTSMSALKKIIATCYNNSTVQWFGYFIKNSVSKNCPIELFEKLSFEINTDFTYRNDFKLIVNSINEEILRETN